MSISLESVHAPLRRGRKGGKEGELTAGGNKARDHEVVETVDGLEVEVAVGPLQLFNHVQ